MKKNFLVIFIILIIVVFIVLMFFYLGKEKEDLSSLNLKDIPDTPINKICLKISLPDDLYYCLAVANQDMNFCEYLDMPDQRKLCQGMAARDISYCREIQEPGPRKMCYYELSFTTGNFNYCDEADDPNDCYFAFIHRLHWESRADEIRAEYCEKINDNTTEGKIFKKFFKQPLSFCDTKFQAPNGLFKYKDDCLIDRAMSEKDSSICAEIKEEELRDLCYGNMSTHISPDLSLCNKIVDEMARNMCYTEVAIHFAQEESSDEEEIIRIEEESRPEEPFEQEVEQQTPVESELEEIIPSAYHIENIPYYREDGFCWGASAIMLMMYEGFSGSEIQEFRNILKSGPGGPPDMFRGFREFGVLDKVRIAYSRDFNKQFADFYNRQLLINPEEQVIILENKDEALKKLKELISSDILVMIMGHHGNHYMIVTGYDEDYIYINDPGKDDVFERVDYQTKYEEKTKMLVNNFFEQWNISNFEGGGIGFPGNYGMIWFAKQ